MKRRMLTPNEEYTLAKRYREHGDLDAKDMLIAAYQPFVKKIAKEHRNCGLPKSGKMLKFELEQEGNVGLLQAVQGFEPDKGYRLSTYARLWIVGAILEYIRHAWSAAEIGDTANEKKLFAKLRKVKRELDILTSGDLRPDQIKLLAQDLDVPERQVVEMNRRLRPGDVSLNEPARVNRDSGDGDFGEKQDWLEDEAPNQETRLIEDESMKMLREALSVLNARERRIFEARRLTDPPITLEDLAAEFGISSERVWQIEERVFEKVQSAVIAASEKP
jgi:RNA polymerase sigma-32 factor